MATREYGPTMLAPAFSCPARESDSFAGWDIARLFLTDLDQNTSDVSALKHQMAIHGGIVCNVTPSLLAELE
jgi:hypothetical protein